ncbi:MAG: TonB-dependent receptor [Nannocystaceae bacterium]
MRLDPRILLGVCLAQVAMVTSVEADQGLVTLTGTVTNAADGQPVEGVVVVASSNALQGEATATTDSTGHYRLSNLPPGEYRLQVLGNGFRPYARQSVLLRADATIRLNPQISPEGGEVRDIDIAAPTVDVGSSSTGVNIGSDFVSRVPVITPGGRGSAQRSFEGMAAATPGARSDTYGTSISGTTSPENSYLIDGVSVGHAGFGTNGLALSSEFVSNVSVISGGYMPEYGRAAGGILTATTKSGSNAFHGGAWAYYSPGALEGERKTVVRQGSTLIGETTLAMMGDVGFDVGGPLIADKLWFYVGVDAARSEYDTTTSWNRLVLNDDGTVKQSKGLDVTKPIEGSMQEHSSLLMEYQALAKLTYSPTLNHRIMISGTFAPQRSGGDGNYAVNTQTGRPDSRTAVNGTFDSTAFTRDGYAATSTLKWLAKSKDKRWDFETTLGWNRLRTTRLPIDGSAIGDSRGLASQPLLQWREDRTLTELVDLPGAAPDSACDPVDGVIVCPAPFGFSTGGTGFMMDRQGTTYSASHVISRGFKAAGHHVVKLGADGNYVGYATIRGYSGQAILAERGPGVWSSQRRYGYLTEAGELVGTPFLTRTSASMTIGGFLQDSWNIADTLTLNIGGRYDLQNTYREDGSLFLSLPNQISPRVGFVYDFTKEGRSKIFANYGRFFQNVPLNIVDRSSGEPGVFAYYACEDPLEDVEECYDNPQPIFGDAEPSPQYVTYGSGVLPIDSDIKPPSSDEIVVGAEYEILARTRLGANYTKRWINRIIEDMSRDEATTYFLGNPGEGIAKDFPEARRDYDAVNLYIDRQFHKRWSIMGSYTLSWLRGNIAGLYRPSTGQLDPFVNSDFDLISLLPNRYGPLGGDNRHVIKVYSAGEVPLPGKVFLTVGGGANARSGSPTNYYGRHEQYGPREVFILERGSGPRLPWRYAVDLSVGVGYAFNHDVRVRLVADVYNVANFQTVTARDQTYTDDSVAPIEGSSDTGDLASLMTTPDPEGNSVAAEPNENFGEATAYQTPRRFRFGLRFEF